MSAALAVKGVRGPRRRCREQGNLGSVRSVRRMAFCLVKRTVRVENWCMEELYAHLYAEMGVERARRDDERERASKAPGSDGTRFDACVT